MEKQLQPFLFQNNNNAFNKTKTLGKEDNFLTEVYIERTRVLQSNRDQLTTQTIHSHHDTAKFLLLIMWLIVFDFLDKM